MFLLCPPIAGSRTSLRLDASFSSARNYHFQQQTETVSGDGDWPFPCRFLSERSVISQQVIFYVRIYTLDFDPVALTDFDPFIGFTL